MSTVSEFPLELNSWELHERSESDRKIRHSVYVLQKTSRREISRGGLVGAANNLPKGVLHVHVLFCLLKLLFFRRSSPLFRRRC